MLPKSKLIGYRPTWAEINLGNLGHNFYQLKKLLNPGVKLLVTVKADAYGHGMIPVARKLSSSGVDWFGVASIDEGIRLREAGIRKPVLVLGLVLPRDIPPLFEYRLTPTVCDIGFARLLSKKAVSLNRLCRLHLKVDTGMGRIGVMVQDALSLAKSISALRNIELEGVFTHFSCADSDRAFTIKQIDLFISLLKSLESAGIRLPLAHAANSMGLIGYEEGHFNMVRPGLAVYGLYPKPGLSIKLKPVLSLKTQVIYVKRVPRSTPISYGGTYACRRQTNIATLPVGYGDGYPRNLSGKAPVLIAGRRLRISGRICMDQIMVDAGDLAVKIGDEVVLIGSQGRQVISAEELARLSATISYEIVCGLGNRIPRVYV